MSLAKPWRPLTRETVRNAPNRYACYELGDDGTTLRFGTGILRDELKEALAYDRDATAVRWEIAESADHAERIRDDHVDD